MARKIRTTFVKATDEHGEKIRAVGPHGQITVAYNYGAYDMHDAAVLEYLCRFNMSNGFARHDDDRRRKLSRSGRGYVYLLADRPGRADINGLLYR